MAKIIEITEEQYGSVTHDSAKTKLINAEAILDIREGSDSKCRILTRGVNNEAVPVERVVSESLATVAGLINVAESTQDALNISVLGDFETVNFVAENRIIMSKDIIEIYVDPDNASQSIITTSQKSRRISNKYVVNDTYANIKTSLAAPISSSYDYTEVTLTAAQLKASTGGFELLAAPGANKYYDVDKIEVNLIYGSVAFDFGTPTKVGELYSVGNNSTNYLQVISPTVLNSAYDNAVIINYNDMKITEKVLDATVTVEEYNEWIFNEPLSFVVDALMKPTVGDSNLLFKIWYKTKTFGSEL